MMKMITTISIACICAVGCYNEADYLPDSDWNDEVFDGLKINSSEIFADGNSELDIVFHFPLNISSEIDSIIFEVEGGTLIGGDTRCAHLPEYELGDSSKLVRQTYTAGFEPGHFVIKTSIGPYVRRDTVELINSCPESLEISASSHYLNIDSAYQTVTLVATLTSETGSASNGYLIEGFEINEPGESDDQGVFISQSVASNSGVCTASFSIASETDLVPGDQIKLGVTVGTGLNDELCGDMATLNETVTIYIVQ